MGFLNHQHIKSSGAHKGPCKGDNPKNACGEGCLEIGVPKNSGTPKWMVYNGKPY